MDKVILEYNPYTKEKTTVIFNDREPRINSQVEKYQNGKLQDWLSEIPRIFYDEMNGYDFEVEYSGTIMDFEQLEKAFLDAGVTEEQVKLFHKSELESREQKIKDIDELLKWMAKPNSGVFDFDSFKESHEELLNEEYNIITINGSDLPNDFKAEYRIAVEDIDKLEDLEDVSPLENTPIVIRVTKDLLPKLQSIVDDLEKREDIDEDQVFFMIDKMLDPEMVKRIIRDHGISRLQIVDSLKDEVIKDYYYAYPVTDHIAKMIEVLSEKAEEVRKIVDGETAKVEKTSGETHDKIDRIDEKLMRLREALRELENRTNVSVPHGCIEARENLYNEIESWKKNKVKIPEESAEENALVYNNLLSKYYHEFLVATQKSIYSEEKKIQERFGRIYEKTGYVDFRPTLEMKRKTSVPRFPSLKNQFLKLKSERFVPQKPDLKDRIFGDSKDIRPHILETTYYCKEWRDLAVNTLIPLAKDVIKQMHKDMINELDQIAEEYIDRLRVLIKENESKKEAEARNLSKTEYDLQNNKTWVDTLQDEINKLKRN